MEVRVELKKLFVAVIFILAISVNITVVRATKGYIYDETTGNRIVGAAVTCEIWNEQEW